MFWNPFLWAGLLILIYVIFAWVVSIIKKDTSVVDIFWGAGFVVAAAVYFILTDGYLPRKLLILILVAIWGLRLSIYIGIRNHGKPEDPRYTSMREKHGNSWPVRSLFTVFILQGILMWIISIPLLTAQLPVTPPYLYWLDYLGIIFWVIGFYFEAVGDYQLYRFKQDPRNSNKVLSNGLWGLTRHPNYFGEFAMWWGYGLIAITGGYYWVLLSPLIMSILVMKFSGVGLLEKNLKEKKPGYREYIETTSVFFPWPKKSS
ncbi:MAG: DUF1295 domain-containing protein [candidate division Zixibacteria bacterium]|nr:DUF1295 domain-containing protein [candidate division Zixibacteria bacterium]